MPRPWTVNKARRNEAIFACEQMASSNDQWGICSVHSVAANVHVKTPIAVLAQAAFDAVFYYHDLYGTVREVWAEAAYILEMGWTPGDMLILKSTQLEAKPLKAKPLKVGEVNASNIEETETVFDDGPIETGDVQSTEFDNSNEDCATVANAVAEEVHEIDLSTVKAFEGIDRGVAEENLAGGNWTPEAIAEADRKVRAIFDENPEDVGNFPGYDE